MTSVAIFLLFFLTFTFLVTTRFLWILNERIDLFTVVCLVAWPLNESEAGADLVLIETSLLLLC